MPVPCAYNGLTQPQPLPSLRAHLSPSSQMEKRWPSSRVKGTEQGCQKGLERKEQEVSAIISCKTPPTLFDCLRNKIAALLFSTHTRIQAYIALPCLYGRGVNSKLNERAQHFRDIPVEIPSSLPARENSARALPTGTIRLPTFPIYPQNCSFNRRGIWRRPKP